MLVRKTIFGGLSVLGDIHAEFYDGQAHDIVASGRLQAGEDLYVTTTSQLVGDVTIGNPALGTTTLTVYGLISVPPGPGYTSGLVIERNATIDGTLDVSGTLDVTGEVTLSDDVTMGIGKTLKVDNIFKANAGLGLLTIEGIGVEGDFLYTDNIAEKTAANGIRIDLLKIKDNTIDLVSGTEVIFEKKVRIRDPLYLEVTNIREGDLSSGIHLDSNTYLPYTDTYTRILRMIGDGRLGGTTAVYYIFNNDSTPASTSITLTAFDCEVLHLDLIANVGGGGITRTYNVEMDHFETFNCPRTFSIITESDNTPLASGGMIVNFRSAANNIIATFTNGTITKKYYETQLAWLGTAWAVVSNAETSALVV